MGALPFIVFQSVCIRGVSDVGFPIFAYTDFAF